LKEPKKAKACTRARRMEKVVYKQSKKAEARGGKREKLLILGRLPLLGKRGRGELSQ